MRRVCSVILLLGLAGIGMVSADTIAPSFEQAHAEMSEALATQVDLQPPPLALPTQAAAPTHAAAASAVKHPVLPHAALEASGRAADQAQVQGSSQALAHQAQSAAASAAGQAQSAAAKERASHPHPSR